MWHIYKNQVQQPVEQEEKHEQYSDKYHINIGHMYKGDDAIFYLFGSGKAVIVWGLDVPQQLIKMRALPANPEVIYTPDEWKVPHPYTDNSPKPAMVYGKITGFRACSTESIFVLDTSAMPFLRYLYLYREHFLDVDVTKNPALKTLVCSGNRISTLDISKNPALRVLRCEANTMERDALVQIFNDLPRPPNGETAFISCMLNPGFEKLTEADKNIARAKRWHVFEDK